MNKKNNKKLKRMKTVMNQKIDRINWVKFMKIQIMCF